MSRLIDKRSLSSSGRNSGKTIRNIITYNDGKIVGKKRIITDNRINPIHPKLAKAKINSSNLIKSMIIPATKQKRPLSDNTVKKLMAEAVMGLLDYVQATSQLHSIIVMKNNMVSSRKMEKAVELRNQEKDTVLRLKKIEKRLGKIRMKLYNF